MRKIYLTFFFFAVAALVLAGFLFFKKSGSTMPQSWTLPKPHVYQNPKQDISKIALKIFYVAPKNAEVSEIWQSNINSILRDVTDFHAIQFHGLSKISPQIYPQPVILKNDAIFYDTANTDYGNPRGLLNIIPELENRYQAFLETANDEFRAIAVVYEGVGASGSLGAMLFSHDYLVKDEYALNRASLFYHELAHTYGLPDRFDLKTNSPFSNDIMGDGRFKPIATNYIHADLLADLGL